MSENEAFMAAIQEDVMMGEEAEQAALEEEAAALAEAQKYQGTAGVEEEDED